MNITPDDERKLDKIIGMLGSAHDGERASAASLIQNIAQKYKITISELMTFHYNKRASPPPPPPLPPPPPPTVEEEDGMLEALLHIDSCPKMYPSLDNWERKFCHEVSHRYNKDSQLSGRQVNVILKIIRKAHADLKQQGWSESDVR